MCWRGATCLSQREQVPAITAEETDLKRARQTALEQRPEVGEAEIDSQRAVYDQKLAKGAFIPEVAAAFNYVTTINTQLLPQNKPSIFFSKSKSYSALKTRNPDCEAASIKGVVEVQILA